MDSSSLHDEKKKPMGEGNGKPSPTTIGYKFLCDDKGELVDINETYVRKNFGLLQSIFRGMGSSKDLSDLSNVVKLTKEMLTYIRKSLVHEYRQHLNVVANTEDSLRKYTRPTDIISHSTNAKNYPNDTAESYMTRNIRVIMDPLGKEMMFWLRPAINKFEEEYNVVITKLEHERARKSFIHLIAQSLYNNNNFQALRRGFKLHFGMQLRRRKPTKESKGNFKRVKYGGLVWYVSEQPSSHETKVSFRASVREAIKNNIARQELLDLLEQEYSQANDDAASASQLSSPMGSGDDHAEFENNGNVSFEVLATIHCMTY